MSLSDGRACHGCEADHCHPRQGPRLSILVSALLSSTTVIALVFAPGQARAQSTWQGTTSDYNSGSNWDIGTAPLSSGQSAVFGGTGSTAVNVSSTVSPDSWTFNSSAQSYNISGSAVTFGGNGIIDNASGVIVSISNNIQGTGGVTLNGQAIMTLSGSNIYSGATNIGGDVQLTAGSVNAFSPNSDFIVNGFLALNGYSNSVGSLSGNGIVTNNASGAVTLTVGGNNRTTVFDGYILQGGDPLSLTVTGTGTLILAGNIPAAYAGYSSYAGITTINSGATLQDGNGGSSGELGTGNVVDNGTLIFNRSDNVTIANAISGSGGLTQAGSGTLTLTGNNIYGGGTTINSGILSVGADANLGAATGALTLNGGTLEITGTSFSSTSRGISLGAGGGTFQIDAPGSTFTLSQSLTGPGSLSETGAGLLVITGTNSYSGGTIIGGTIAGGQVQLGTATSQGKIVGSVTVDGRLVVSNADMSQITSIANSAGTIEFVNAASASNATITNNGSLEFDNTATAGTAPITTGAGAYLRFYNSGTAGSAVIATQAGGLTEFYNNSTGGSGRFITDTGGNVDFSGSTGPNNDGKLAAGSIEGAGTYSLGSDELTVGGNNLSTTLSGVITDGGIFGGTGGSLVKTGTGTFTLAGTSSYTGATMVEDGTLQAGANNAFAPSSAFAVASGATLDLGGFGQTIGSLSGSGAVTNNGSAVATLTVGRANASTTFGGTLQNGSNPLVLDVTGTGTLTLCGNSSYSGGTTVESSATLAAGSVTAFSARSDFTVNGMAGLPATAMPPACITIMPASSSASTFRCCKQSRWARKPVIPPTAPAHPAGSVRPPATAAISAVTRRSTRAMSASTSAAITASDLSPSTAQSHSWGSRPPAARTRKPARPSPTWATTSRWAARRSSRMPASPTSSPPVAPLPRPAASPPFQATRRATA